jgi:hypothetical protein
MRGVDAVMLGGSRAAGTHQPTSDWDFAIYYRGDFDVGEVSALGFPGEVFPLGGWGGGVFNGGAWLTVGDRRVDVCYRDLDDVEHRVAEAERGEFKIEHLAFYLAGIPTYVVVAELALGQLLHGRLPRPTYSEALKRRASTAWQGRAELTLSYASAYCAARGDIIGTLGLATRALYEASHARLAERGIWITNEKALVARAGLTDTGRWFAGLSADVASLGTFIGRLREAITEPR